MGNFGIYNKSGEKIGEIKPDEPHGGGAAGVFLAIPVAGFILWLTFTGKNDAGVSMLLTAAAFVVFRGIYLISTGRNRKGFGATFLDLCIWGTAAPLAVVCMNGVLTMMGVLPGDIGIGEFIFLAIAGAFMIFVHALVPAAIGALVLKMLQPKK